MKHIQHATVFKSFQHSVMLVVALFITSTLMSAYGPVIWADEGGSGEKRKTRKAASMGEKVYKKLTEAQELIEAKNYKQGLSVLGDLEKQPKLTPYEKAQLYNYFAYTYFTLEQYRDAIRSYEKVLQQPELPEALEINSLYTLAQLYFIIEDYKKAIQIINKWFARTERPTENAYMLLGQAYYQLEQYKQSLAPLKKAYSLVKARGDQPKENLLLLMRVNYFNLGDYKNMIEVLKEMVALYPKPEYWLTMAGSYSELKRYDKQMAIMEMMYESGNLQKGNQQLNLANLYLLHDVPYKAALVLEKGIKEGKIEKKVKNLRLLSQAWIQAGHSKRSISPLKQAASKAKDGDLEVRLGQAYLNLNQYKNAVDAINRGLEKGGIKRKDQAYLMLGSAQIELQQYNSALQSMQNASRDKRSRKSAEQWIEFIRSEMSRKKTLEEALSQRSGVSS